MRAVLSGAAALSPQHIKHLVLATALLALPLLATAGTGALDRIKAAKTITIAYAPNAYPISFRDADGAPRGYSVDLCRRVVLVCSARWAWTRLRSPGLKATRHGDSRPWPMPRPTSSAAPPP